MTDMVVSTGRGSEALQEELAAARAHANALQQLLEVHEQIAIEQAEKLESALRVRDQLLDRERAARTALEESERRLRLAFETGRMGSWEWDIETNRVTWSEEEERLYGLEPGTFSGTIEEYAARIHPEDREEAIRLAMEAVERRADAHHVMHRIVLPDGRIRWLDSHARFLYAEDGRPVRLVGISQDVTERLEIQAARDAALAEARSERQRLYEVFMQAPAAIAVLEGPNHVFRAANALYLDLVGGRNVLGRSVAEAIPEAVSQGFVALLDQVYATGEAYSARETQVILDRDLDGVPETLLYVDFVYQPLKTAAGATFGMMVHAVDTTAMVRARQEVEALAAERSAILGQIADVVITADPEGRVTFFNAAARTLYGEIRTGLPMWDDAQEFRLLDVDGERRRPEQTPIWRALQGERVFNDVWKIQRPDGTLVEVVGSAVPILHLKGQPIGAAMTVHDVTAERKLQRELAHERSRLHDLLMQAPASILVSEGPEHVLVLQNQFCRLLVGGRNVVGQRMADAFPEIVPQGFIALMDEVYRTGEPYEGRETYVDFDRNADGKLENGYFNFIYQPLRDADRRVYGILAFAVEVTDQVLARREVERRAEELAQLTRELERSNRDLDQFAYVASHDLKAPLRGIANLTEWIAEDLGERVSGESREHMHLLKGRVNRMEALIDGILQYSRAGRRMGKVETVESEKLVREVVELLSPEPDVTIEIAPDMPVLQAERTPLQQVFLNLIANAVKHGRPPVHVRISAQREGDRVRFGVQDNGPGIAPQFQERIWQIFQTLAPRDTTEGTGIGLSVVRKIVDAHGGRAWVESAEGQGATFYFTWPLVETRE